MTRDNSCNQMRHITIIWMDWSNEANYNHFNGLIKWEKLQSFQWTDRTAVIKCKLQSFEWTDRTALTKWGMDWSCIPPACQYIITWWSDLHQLAQYHMVVRSPPVSTVPNGGQITPVSTVLHGGQIIVHSISQHSTTWWSDLHRSVQYHMVVRSPPVSTVPHGGQITTGQYSTTWWSDHHRSAQYHMVVRSPPVSTVPHGGQMTSGQYSTNVVVRRKLGTKGKRRGFELSAEPWLLLCTVTSLISLGFIWPGFNRCTNPGPLQNTDGK